MGKISKVLFKHLPILELIKGEFQPKKEVESKALQELADSIQQLGILQPLLVRARFNNTYEIIAGERRWRAAQLAGLKEVPCIISYNKDDEALMTELIEDLSRQDLNPIEKARGVVRLIEEFKLGHKEVSQILGSSRSEISNLVRLLKLDLRVQTLLISGDLNGTQGKLLTGIPKEHQYLLARKAIAKGWSSRSLEKAIRQFKNSTLEEEEKNKGHFRITYHTLDELAGVLERIGWQDE